MRQICCWGLHAVVSISISLLLHSACSAEGELTPELNELGTLLFKGVSPTASWAYTNTLTLTDTPGTARAPIEIKNQSLSEFALK